MRQLLRVPWLWICTRAFGIPLVRQGFEDVEEAFVIGDLHADVHCAKQWVRQSGLVDLSTWTWVGGSRQALVFMGDYVDKGPHGRQVLEFVRNLTVSFPHHVLAMLGNHDLYLLFDALFYDGASQLMGAPVRDFVYAFTHPEEYLNWIPPGRGHINDTAIVLPALYDALQSVYERNAMAHVMLSARRGSRNLFTGVQPFNQDPNLAQQVQRRLREFQAFMSRGLIETGLAQWLASLPIVAVVGGALIVHGGLPSADLLALVSDRPSGSSEASLPQLLERATTEAFTRAFGSNMVAPNSVRERLQTMMGSSGSAELVHEAVTYRGFFDTKSRSGPSACEEVRAVLKHLQRDSGVELVVVGHTPEDTVRISCGGRLGAVDSSLSRYFRAYGNLYCPIAVEGVKRRPHAGCTTPVPEQCAGEASRLRRSYDGRWHLHVEAAHEREASAPRSKMWPVASWILVAVVTGCLGVFVFAMMSGGKAKGE
eukprot:TRINITY_DN54632_c0_g1_i1.p1 TRINITY_DN54632_c0_g1~~TRINITY_DN54632_c0_g1_i1.p1  ORF type:complete len:482 (+),score=38.71 TRINITY_DN54632_c0_g1_i1:71-1516(+)